MNHGSYLKQFDTSKADAEKAAPPVPVGLLQPGDLLLVELRRRRRRRARRRVVEAALALKLVDHLGQLEGRRPVLEVDLLALRRSERLDARAQSASSSATDSIC